MMLRLMRYVLLGLVLLLVFCASALLAMRFAIHGREVRVPRFSGLTTAEAERVAMAEGLVLSIEGRFYTAGIPEGRIASQSPVAGARVRRGWKVVVAESLGPQHAAIPNLIGQSQHAASINVSRHGLEIGSVGALHWPGAQPGTVVAQNPLPNTKDVASPKIDLLVAAADNAKTYVMPSFLGKSLEDAASALESAGLTLGEVRTFDTWPVSVDGTAHPVSGTVVKQRPLAGQKVSAGAAIDLDVQR
jgi:beta-lactam-binding protein with PASTA domain